MKISQLLQEAGDQHPALRTTFPTSAGNQFSSSSLSSPEMEKNVGKTNAEQAPQQEPPPYLLRLPNEIIGMIVDAFPVDPRLPNISHKPSPHSPKCQTDFRQTTRLSLWSLSRTCRRIHLASQRRLFSNIHIDNGKSAGLLLRSLVEFPHLRAYVHQLDLRFSLDHSTQCYDGLFECIDLDLDAIPSFHASVLKRSGILDQNGAINAGPVQDVFQTLIGLMLSLTTCLEGVFLGFDVRHHRDLEDTSNGVETFLSLFRGVDTTCVAIEDLVVSDDVVVDRNANGGTVAKTSHHREYQLLPSLRSLSMGYSKGSGDFSNNGARHRLWPFNLPSLLALPSLVSLTTSSDATQWGYLDRIQWPEPFFALETLTLRQETAPGSALCCILRRCPNLKTLEIDLDPYSYSTDMIWSRPGSLETARISDAIPKSCPRLRSLTLRIMSNPRFFFPDEPNPTWLAGMTDLTILRTNLPCLFKDADDMITANICERLPPNLKRLVLDDLWIKDTRVVSLSGWPDPGPDGFLFRESESLDASAEPFAIMLSRLVLSRISGNLTSLQSVTVRSSIFEKDTGSAAQDLTQAFAAAGIKLEVLPFIVWPTPKTKGYLWSMLQTKQAQMRERHVKHVTANTDRGYFSITFKEYREWQAEKKRIVD